MDNAERSKASKMARPRFRPTEEQRRKVKLSAAYGMPHDQIACKIGIRSPKTLRRHFRRELEAGRAEGNSQVAQTLFKMAISGKYPQVTIYWMRVQAGWNDQPTTIQPIAPAPPFIVTTVEGES
jgi:hypothetical protein